MSVRHRQVVLWVAVLVFIPAFLFATRNPSHWLVENAPLKASHREGEPAGTGLYSLSANFDIVNGTQVVWQIPPPPKAVLFVAHGCHCRATFFWDRSSDCAECVGLPEERSLVSAALGKSYAVVAISSLRDCWSLSLDKENVKSILKWWMHEKELERLPIVALGASSGGYFVSALARELKFESVVLMISEGVFTRNTVRSNYPPTLFVHMPKDKGRASRIEEAMLLLQSKEVKTAEVKCYEVPVTPGFFTKIPGMDITTSERIYGVLQKGGILDERGFMKKDGRSTNWQVSLKKQGLLQNQSAGKLKWEAHVQELLNLAYGYHEMTSLQADRIFEWFDSHLPTTKTSS